jgi:dTDP-4-dehydrorhamnose 3,5-epimerase
MKFEELKLKGVFLIHAEGFEDERGVFRRNYCKEEFNNCGIDSNVAQANISENTHKHTIRGFHYQTHPFGESKTMTVIKGRIYDIIVDLRKDSPTYLEWVSLNLSPDRRTSFHVPAGCANAFLTMEDDTLVHYYSSFPFTENAEKGIRYNDPFFKFDWPIKVPQHISVKDNSWPDFKLDS